MQKDHITNHPICKNASNSFVCYKMTESELDKKKDSYPNLLKVQMPNCQHNIPVKNFCITSLLYLL